MSKQLRLLDEAIRRESAAGNEENVRILANEIFRIQAMSRRGAAPTPLLSREQIAAGKAAMTSELQQAARNRLLGLDPNISTDTFNEPGFRADYSRQDTDAERIQYLNKRVGEDGWTRDKYGKVAITPAGQAKLGRKPLDRSMYLDEPGMTWNDLADMRGAAPEIIGGIAAGLLTSGASIPASLAAAGLGSAFMRGSDELLDEFQGHNLQSASQVAGDVAMSGIQGTVGEGIGRLSMGMGRRVLGPNANRVIPDRKQTMDELVAKGIYPPASNVVKSSLFRRIQRLGERVFGEEEREKNIAKLIDRFDELRFDQGLESNTKQLGEQIRSAWKATSKQIDLAAKDRYAFLETPAGRVKNIDTAPIRARAQELLTRVIDTKKKQKGTVEQPFFNPLTGQMESVPRPKKPLVSKLNTETAKTLKRYTNLDTSSALQLHVLRRELNDPQNEFAKKLGSYEKGELKKAITEVLENYPGIKEADEWLANIRGPFRNKNVRALGQPDESAKSPEDWVKLLTNPKSTKESDWDSITKALPESTIKRLRRRAFDNLLDKALKTDKDGTPRLNPQKLLKSIRGMNKDLIGKAFDREAIDSLEKYARGLQLVAGKESDAGGLVAASIALRPIQNLPTMARLAVVKSALESPKMLKYLTVGVVQPKTPAGKVAVKVARYFFESAARTASQSFAGAYGETTDMRPNYGSQ
jgi:Arc/MetJ-type ribon-helix-helix transcriptional regulator